MSGEDKNEAPYEPIGDWIQSASIVRRMNQIWKALGHEVETGEWSPENDDWECRLADDMVSFWKKLHPGDDANHNTFSSEEQNLYDLPPEQRGWGHPTCEACWHGAPGQRWHMQPGGCLADPSVPDWSTPLSDEKSEKSASSSTSSQKNKRKRNNQQ